MDIDSAAEAIDTIVQRAYCGESVGIAEITPILTQLIASERSNFADLIDKEIAGLAKRLTKK